MHNQNFYVIKFFHDPINAQSNFSTIRIIPLRINLLLEFQEHFPFSVWLVFLMRNVQLQVLAKALTLKVR